MKVVVNTLALLSPMTGLGYYTYHIVKNLQAIDFKNEYTFFHGLYSKKFMPAPAKRKALHALKEVFRKPPFLNHFARDLKGLLGLFSREKFDLYFEPNFIPLNIPAHFLVVTVLDFSFIHFPQFHPKEKIKYFGKNFLKKIKTADRIICISNFIRNEAINLFGLEEEKIVTIHLGINHEIFHPNPFLDAENIYRHYGLPPKFILFVGSIEPRKNLNKLLQAYSRLNRNLRKEFKLVLVGFRGWENKEIFEMIHRMEGDVFYLGYLPEEDLAKVYNLASLMVYPSIYEGFGLPPLEAMACGCPVIVSNTASLPEVCADAAYYVDPGEVDSITAGIEKLLSDEELRSSHAQKGLIRAADFRWEESAQKHLHVFEEVTGRK